MPATKSVYSFPSVSQRVQPRPPSITMGNRLYVLAITVSALWIISLCIVRSLRIAVSDFRSDALVREQLQYQCMPAGAVDDLDLSHPVVKGIQGILDLGN